MYMTGQPRRAPDMPFDYSGVDPSRVGGGLLSAARRAMGGGGGAGGIAPSLPQGPSAANWPTPTTPPINPQMSGGQSQFMQAFSQNPQFQQQLMAMMQGQSPGFQQPQFTPMPAALPVPGAQGR